jgi:uncharacterized repeat protein (TIGR01451 family)
MKTSTAISATVTLSFWLFVAVPAASYAQVVDTSDLSIDLDASAPQILSGSNVTYTITVSNDGDASSAFTITNELPAETTFVSCTATGGGVCGESGNSLSIAFIGGLAANATATITVVANVNCCVKDGTDIVDTAEIHPSVVDPDADEVDNESVFVTVVNPPPKVTNASVTPSQLWPPNHKMANVAVNYTIEDNCGPVTVTLSVASNEPINGTGDGDTAPDWIIVNDHQVQLRSERAGTGTGRIYTITITATDCAGQADSANVTVTVPHDRK